MKKRYLYSILSIILINLIFLSIPVNSEIMDNKVEIIKVGGDNNYPPYEFIDKEGTFRGFNVDIMKAISIELGIEIDLIPMTWEEAMLNLESEDIDMVQGMTKSSYRESLFNFSEPLIINSQAIFVRNDTNDVATLQDLSGKKVSFQKADVSMEISEKMKNINRFVMENQEEAIELLLNGEVDAFVGNRYTGIYYLQKSNNYNKVKIVGGPMHETEYCVAVKKGNDRLLREINKGIKEIKSNGTYDKIYNKWFGESITSNVENLRKWMRLIIFFLLLTFVILIANFYWNKLLKEKVEERTRELDIKNIEIKKQRNKIDSSNILRGTILTSIVSGIIVFDKDDNIIEFNSAAEDLLNIELNIGDNFKSLNLEDNGLIGYEDSKQGYVYKDNKKIIIDDEKIYVNYNYIPIKDKDGGVILLINDYTDIETYQQMASYNDKMQALGELSAGIAHEIRNPLTSIKTFIDLIPYKIDDEEFRKELVDISSKEILRMNELITQLIDYTKPIEKNLSYYSLEKLINEILLLFTNTLTKNNIKLKLDIEDIEIHGDANQIKQVLVNIILNSIEAIEDSGTIEISSRKIEDNKVEITVLDNGIGIAKKYLDKIYNPFFTQKAKGTGIGLAITRKIISENNGSIKLKSKEGQWTKAILTLPIN